MRLPVLLTVVALGCGHPAPKDRTVPEDLELDEGPWQDRLPTDDEDEPAAGVDAGAQVATPSLKVEIVSDPGEADSRIDLAVRDAPIRDVLRMIAVAANVGLVVADDVQGSVTLDVDNVSWRQAIDVIAHLENLVITEVDGVLLVKRPAATP